MAEELPLFPLGTVLLPGTLLPLHVFEPRCRDLVRDLLQPTRSAPEFGVVAIRAGFEVGEQSAGSEGSLHEVGCVAVLREVAQLPDGRYAVTSVGRERFRLRGLAVGAGTAYLTGLVDRLPEPDGAGPDVYARAVARRFGRYAARLGLEAPAPQDPADQTPQELSYRVAAAMVLDETDRQRLLECPDTAARLEAELALLTQELALIESFRARPAIELTRAPFAPN